MSIKPIMLDDTLYNYMLSISLHEPPILEEIRKFSLSLPSRTCLLTPEQGQFLAWLIRLLGIKKVLEIGTYTGYSAAAMALALPDTGELITCDRDENITVDAKRFWKKANLQHKIKLELGLAEILLKKLIQEKQVFDLIFVDADKANNRLYYELGLPLLKTNGVMIFDNTLWKGAVADPSDQHAATQAIRAFNQFIYEEKRADCMVLPLGDGTTLIRKIV